MCSNVWCALVHVCLNVLMISLFFVFYQVVSDAAGQGVTITGERTFNNWNWPNAVIFAATVITTIGKQHCSETWFSVLNVVESINFFYFPT